MEPTIITIQSKKLVGQSLTMSLMQNKTGDLWRGFMPRHKEIAHPVTTELISMQVYHQPMRPGDPGQEFVKWAAMEVADFDTIPEGMQSFTLPAWLYAVFHYRGSSADIGIFQYIYGVWLPASTYALDQRPHFEVLGEKYKNMDPESEEDIYIPIRER